MRQVALRGLILAMAAAIIPACGGGSSGGGGSAGTSVSNSGGTARGSTVAGGTSLGGGVGISQFVSVGDLNAGVNGPPSGPFVPSVPTTGTAITTLNGSPGETIANGNGLVTGTLLGSGAAARTITVSDGDLVVSGTINSGQNGGTQINLTLSAPNGTVYITGTVRTASVDGVADGDIGGNLAINARRIVVTGVIDASGENNGAGNAGNGGSVGLDTSAALSTDIVVTSTITSTGGNGIAGTGGNGGAVTLNARGDLQVSGSINVSGGTATAITNSIQAGNGGVITMNARGTAVITGTITQDGGNATGTGAAVGANSGSGGTLSIDTAANPAGPLFLYGSRSARGGNGLAPTGTVGNPIRGGNGGSTVVGAGAPNGPATIDFGSVAWTGRGGDSDDVGGACIGNAIFQSSGTTNGNAHFIGTVDATSGSGTNVGGTHQTGGAVIALTGNVYTSGSFLVRAGNGGTTPGTNVNSYVTQAAGGDLTFTGFVDHTGASSSALVATNTAGANAGNLIFACTGTLNMTGASLLGNGGNSTGTSTAGAGAAVLIFTNEGHISYSGTITANGGTANGTGGTGGLGGSVIIDGDADFDNIGGDVTLTSGSSIFVDGGNGAIGGNARTVAGAEAVQFNSDNNLTTSGAPAAAHGVIRNNGSIFARGGSGTTQGNGGLVRFDGQDGSLVPAVPAPGNITATGAVVTPPVMQ